MPVPAELLIIYFVSLGVCSLSTIYKTACFNNMLCRRIMGNMFWSLVPVVNTFKAVLWITSLLVQWWNNREAQQRKPTGSSSSNAEGKNGGDKKSPQT